MSLYILGYAFCNSLGLVLCFSTFDRCSIEWPHVTTIGMKQKRQSFTAHVPWRNLRHLTFSETSSMDYSSHARLCACVRVCLCVRLCVRLHRLVPTRCRSNVNKSSTGGDCRHNYVRIRNEDSGRRVVCSPLRSSHVRSEWPLATITLDCVVGADGISVSFNFYDPYL